MLAVRLMPRVPAGDQETRGIAVFRQGGIGEVGTAQADIAPVFSVLGEAMPEAKHLPVKLAFPATAL